VSTTSACSPRSSPKDGGALRRALASTALAGLLAAAAPLMAAPPSDARAAAPAAGAARTATDPMARRMQACTPCHGREGRATPEGYFPRIAGKPAGYLFNQLVHFREGRRGNAAMGYLVQHLSDDYLREIAEWFARQDLPYPPPPPTRADQALLARGERLVREGDPARRLPSCAACHGEALTGVLPAMPGLLGLPRDYIAGQLGAWRSKQRRAAEPDCMAEVSARMDGADVAAVAAWLSAQTVPAAGRPAAAPPGPLPLRCGSMP
jgi:cytochrome c553